MTDTPAIQRGYFSLRFCSLIAAAFTLQLVSFSNSHADTLVTPEKVVIDADHVRMNILSGNSTYSGNVKITQGELKLTGDKVTLIESNNEIERMTVIGNPARYNHVTEDGQTVEAESEKMVYTVSENKLVLTHNAKLKQPDHQVSSQKITYDTVKKIIIAGDRAEPSAAANGQTNGTEKDQSHRVNITLTPKKPIQPESETSITPPAE